MVALYLLAALLVLLTSDGARSHEDTECAYGEWYKFCRHVKAAYDMNEEAIQHLKDHHYIIDKMRLREIDHTLLEVLREKNQTELVDKLLSALYREVRELTHLEPKCSAQGWEYDCSVAVMAVVQATIELVEAIEGVAEGIILDLVKEAYKQYLDDLRQGKQSITRLCVALVLAIIKAVFEGGHIEWRPNIEALETFVTD